MATNSDASLPRMTHRLTEASATALTLLNAHGMRLLTVPATWLGSARRQMQRLRLFAELGRLPNPRFGPDRFIALTLQRLCDFLKADNCIAVMADDEGPRIHATGGLEQPFARDARISLPLESGGRVMGQLYVLSRRRRYGDADIGLLREAIARFMPLVEALTLLDRQASSAARKERRRISLDLHDSAIQPYLGLRLGLEALRRKAAPGNALAGDIDDLYRMTEDSIAELRGYVRGLDGRTQVPAGTLAEGLKRQAERFRAFYGIDADIQLLSPVDLNDRLSAEVVQMVGEGLSNIGRHTSSRRATITLCVGEGHLVLRIVNHGETGRSLWHCFTPSSLTRRARHLGGTVEVAPEPQGGTRVSVTIPL